MLVLESHEILLCCQMIERAIFSWCVYYIIILLEQPAVTKCMHNNVYMHIIYDDTADMLLAGNEAIIIYHIVIKFWWVTSSHHAPSIILEVLALPREYTTTFSLKFCTYTYVAISQVPPRAQCSHSPTSE